MKKTKYIPAMTIVIAAVLMPSIPAFASESHGEFCSRDLAEFIEKHNLTPPQKTFNKAMGLCREFKQSEARKELLKSPRRPTGREVRNVMGRCVEVAGGVNANRRNVQIFECNGTKSQKWVFTRKKEIRNIMGRCLEVAGGVNANRTNVQIFECNGTKSQKWIFTRKKEIRNIMGRCLEVAGGVNANRTNVQIFECNGTKSQIWR